MEGQLKVIEIKDIKPNPYQPRTNFNDHQIDELAQSIEENGLLQPIVVRPAVFGYTLVAGERRLRACKKSNLKYIEVLIKEMTDEEMMTYAILENLQREDLDPFEEASSYKNYMDALNLNQEQVAQKLGKSRSYIANMIRLLKLPHSVINMIKQNKITTAHGRTLLSLKDHVFIEQVAKKVAKEKWNVRETEQFVRQFDNKQPKNDKMTISKPRPILRTEQELKRILGTDVEIKQVGKKGQITLSFTSIEEYKRLVELLKNKEI